MALLDRLERGGYFDHPINWKLRRTELAKDGDFAAIRNRPGFQNLLCAIERKAKPVP